MRDLSRLVRVRKIWEKQARIQLGQATQELNEAERATVSALDDHRRSQETDGDILIRRIAGMATHDKYTAAELVRRQAEHRTRAAQGSWRRSAQDLDASEKLEERRKQALAYLARRSSEATLDELMAMRRRKR
ncbi:MAG: hypothetical protein OEX04_19590 [Acidimicrobiia bacterium]|nr:hypothetical protein [Acidimicrobiia bacterium]MDH4309680.1 hypothetical protein [Acidimicrobiia bacterium]MDH5292227.1 hypothetical protein [Acidimicrobiia bacterium]